MRCDQRLAQAQAAISSGRFAVREHIEPRRKQPGAEMLEQVEVVKDAATQADAIQRSTRPQEVTNSSKDFDQSIVKSATDF